MKVLLFAFLFVYTRVKHIHRFMPLFYGLNDGENIRPIQTIARISNSLAAHKGGRNIFQMDIIERVGTYDLHFSTSQFSNLMPLCFADDRFSICY
jgi:hypothetical protein